MAERVENYLTQKKNSSKSPDVAEIFQTFEKAYTKKLWHQLTTDVKNALSNQKFLAEVDLKELYDNFIHEFELRINPLQLVEISVPIAKFIFAKSPEESFKFIQNVKKASTVAKDKQALVRAESAEIELHLNNKSGGKCANIAEIRGMIEATQAKLEELVGVTPVHATFYKVSSLYLREIGNHAAYYREALRYLGCEDLTKLTEEEKRMQAVLLGFAALLGENIYNFGELLAHPILKSLEKTSEEWLVQLLYAFNSGDLEKFRNFEAQWKQWPDIVLHMELLEGKIRLLCLMEISLARPSKERYITFSEISQKAHVALNKVEFLVMKALSKGLVRGSIDQVEGIVNITWVQPRVLSPDQIRAMAERMSEWKKDVDGMEGILHENAREILVKT
ncbi:unnamed protein product [Bursaphelenchus okinawaensis]|uniref:26S proteasome non-ATPase regulatory subunit 13 n=1 Tax=Bursaphelenchus okinawaensis TaxID=465554 RepID=A0A811K864_9BILA|nr:unnamed protein product [Bursaphelenchus okinawaensis]CAG9093795.1 unnamed protein product [Bursaphelenchus okinawaensis]